VAALSAGAGAIHAAVVREHAAEYWLFGAFFVLSAVLQLAWAWLILARPSRGLYALGAAGQALVVLIWVVSRTAGLPVGPDAGLPEAAGAADTLSTVLEVLAVFGALAVLRAHAERPTPSVLSGAGAGILAAGLAMAALFAYLLGPGGSGEDTAAGPAAAAGHGVHALVILVAGGLFLVFAILDWVRGGPRGFSWRLKDPQDSSTGTPSSPSR